MRYRLRTLVILTAVVPPVMAAVWSDATGALAAMLCLGVAGVLLPVAVHVWRKSTSQ